jgi:hypothetical protein
MSLIDHSYYSMCSRCYATIVEMGGYYQARFLANAR